ncbi:Crp/Fnr family transcriptional regulator [Longitalea arenae]|uniref:Crp/Fnr family transcriptional regulator n=1 Tax=Longitalea arenae TaxID=2812558 RepID=UPI001967E38F|nr:Crp/Fnr family transcriptional regulator [Longitalea arenae]
MKRLLVIENNTENHNMMESTSLFENGSNAYARVKHTDRLTMLFQQNTNINKYKKKQVIYEEGNHPVQLFYIKKGIVKTYKSNPEGKELITGIYSEGEYLGYVALLEETVYKDIAVAVEYAELAVISKDEFELLMETDWQVAKKFITLLAKDITDKEQLLLGLAYNSLRKKVAEALILLSRKYKDAIKISRDNLAAIAGTATESLIRTLGEFRQEKLIEISEGYITILNETKLRTMLN